MHKKPQLEKSNTVNVKEPGLARIMEISQKLTSNSVLKPNWQPEVDSFNLNSKNLPLINTINSLVNNNASQSTRISPSPDISNKSLETFKGFYHKNLNQRHQILAETNPEVSLETLKSGGLTNEYANLMVENCVGQVNLP